MLLSKYQLRLLLVTARVVTSFVAGLALTILATRLFAGIAIVQLPIPTILVWFVIPSYKLPLKLPMKTLLPLAISPTTTSTTPFTKRASAEILKEYMDVPLPKCYICINKVFTSMLLNPSPFPLQPSKREVLTN